MEFLLKLTDVNLYIGHKVLACTIYITVCLSTSYIHVPLNQRSSIGTRSYKNVNGNTDPVYLQGLINNLLKKQLYYLSCFCVGRLHETFRLFRSMFN